MKHWEQKFTTYMYNHCNICNIPIYFCNPCETLATYLWNIWNTWNICLQHVFFTISFFFRTTRCRAKNGRFQPASDRGWWHGLTAASYTCVWLRPDQRQPSLLVAWSHMMVERNHRSRWGWRGCPRGARRWRSGDGCEDGERRRLLI
jgi:hypothetical protein